MIFNKIAIVNLMGGLGNQLHQIAFSKYLDDIGYNVKIDTSWYDVAEFSDGTTKRSLEINVLDFGFESIKNNKKIINSKSLIIENSRVLKKLYNSHLNFFYKVHYGNEYNDSKYFYLNRFNGYWQSSKYILKDTKEFLIEGLNKNKKFNNLDKNSKTMVHVRKGDYIDWGEDLPLHYFEKALINFKINKKTTKYDIFTDLQEINTNLDFFSKAMNINNNLEDSGIETLSSMVRYKNFIISNSSISFFAAYLGASRESSIYYPHPWFKSIKHMPYTEENWIKIEY